MATQKPVFSLIICTYMRPIPLQTLLDSVQNQTWYPDEILIIDGSLNLETEKALATKQYPNLQYYRVEPAHRGLTKQRNFGINRVMAAAEVVCFLDDDTVLEPDYFEQLVGTYALFPDAMGVGGFIINVGPWTEVGQKYTPKANEYYYDGWKRSDSNRFVIRKKLGLMTTNSPCFMPPESHGRSVAFLPPSGKIYEVQQFMGGVSSFKKTVLDEHKFSTYFEGYGLYEDAEYTLRLSNLGKLYLNTNAGLYHYHDSSGRPDFYHYGKMVIRNGWFVWRTKYPNPTLKARLKWNTIAFLLTAIRFTNVLTATDKRDAFRETLGRIAGWWSLLYNQPKAS
ncbi:glycosyltransferase family 2 protein [Flavobacterium stagni]|uniref:Glycosyltransferase n=1 Tax=Flavobacterium stagni TaxID=2506421 RepID=A0A4Q1KAN9_9FLAO|nr:glycosyltransferase family 2 protein [Flavobacterium stagni]RXR21850.1 glycosyltransferase [Flavobacterium stagni]